MCQARSRKSTSPAQEQAAAAGDVERIAREWYRAAYRGIFGAEPSPTWEQLSPRSREDGRRAVEDLLHRGVIRPGVRPKVEPPMEGQTTIDEHLEGA